MTLCTGNSNFQVIREINVRTCRTSAVEVGWVSLGRWDRLRLTFTNLGDFAFFDNGFDIAETPRKYCSASARELKLLNWFPMYPCTWWLNTSFWSVNIATSVHDFSPRYRHYIRPFHSNRGKSASQMAYPCAHLFGRLNHNSYWFLQ